MVVDDDGWFVVGVRGLVVFWRVSVSVVVGFCATGSGLGTSGKSGNEGTSGRSAAMISGVVASNGSSINGVGSITPSGSPEVFSEVTGKGTASVK